MSKTLFLAASMIAIVVAMTWEDGSRAGQGPGGALDGNSFAKCAESCSNCQRACESCAAHCADMMAQGKKSHQYTLQTCQDCATHCSAAAAIVARKGPFADTICNACAEACSRCAKECDKHASHDMEMKQCAESCRKCEQACREMLAQMKGAKTANRRD